MQPISTIRLTIAHIAAIIQSLSVITTLQVMVTILHTTVQKILQIQLGKRVEVVKILSFLVSYHIEFNLFTTS